MFLVIQRDDLRNALVGSGVSHQFEGLDFGEIPVSFFWTDAPPGTGPKLHQHQYAEVFVVQKGLVTFTVGDETIPASAGQIVIAPAGVPHKFVNSGVGPARHLDIHPMGRMNGGSIASSREFARAQVIDRSSLPHSETAAQFEGEDFGNIPISFFWTDTAAGTGPRLHRHPYAELFVVLGGKVRFTVEGATVDATEGEIVIVPAGVSHRFVNLGPERARHLDLHTAGRMITEWLAEDLTRSTRTSSFQGTAVF